MYVCQHRVRTIHQWTICCLGLGEVFSSIAQVSGLDLWLFQASSMGCRTFVSICTSPSGAFCQQTINCKLWVLEFYMFKSMSVCRVVYFTGVKGASIASRRYIIST